MTKPTISAVIPAYNEEASIAASLDSLLAQTRPFNEIIVVDNNSTDKTTSIVKKYQKSYPNIRLLKEPRQRPIFARNRGFNAAKSDLIARFDVDSRLEQDWVARAQKLFAENSGLMAASGNSSFYNTPVVSQAAASFVHWIIVHRINKFLIGGPMLIGSNTVLRREAWQNVKQHLCERRDIFEDIDLAIHCSQLGLAAAYDEKLRNWVSPRRYSTPLRSIGKYFRKWPRTFAAHRYPYATALAFLAIPLVILFTYLPAYLFLRAYDPARDKLSLKKFVEFEPYDS